MKRYLTVHEITRYLAPKPVVQVAGGVAPAPIVTEQHARVPKALNMIPDVGICTEILVKDFADDRIHSAVYILTEQLVFEGWVVVS